MEKELDVNVDVNEGNPNAVSSPNVDPIYKHKDGRIFTKKQLLSEGYNEERIKTGLDKNLITLIGDTRDADQEFKHEDGRIFTNKQLLSEGYTQERIDNGILGGKISPIEKKNQVASAPTSKDLSVGVSDGTISTIEPPKNAADLFNLQDTKTREDLTKQGFDVNKLNEDLKNIDSDLITEGEDDIFTKDKILKEYKEFPERYERDIATLKFTSLHRKAVSELPKEEANKFSQIFISSNKEENKKIAEDINKYGGSYKKELLDNLSKITGQEYKFLEDEIANDNSDVFSRIGYIFNGLLSGIGTYASGASDVMMQLLTKILPKEALGGTEEEVLKKWREEVEPTIRTATEELYGADVSDDKRKQYEKEFWTQAFRGVASSIPLMIGYKGSGFIIGGYDAGLQSINNTPEGKKLPESTKTIFAASVGIANGLIDKFGLDKIFANQSTRVAIEIATKTISELAEKSAAPLTKEVIEEAIKVNVKSLKDKVIKAGGRIGKGGVIEFVTGGVQESVNIGAEKLVNLSQKKQIFEPQSTGQMVSRVFESAKSEAVGGVLFGGASAIMPGTTNYIAEKVAEAKSEEDIVKLKDEVLVQAKKNNLKENELNQLVSLIDDYVKINSKIPSNVENRKEVIKKIKEKDELKKQIDQKKIELENADDAFKSDIQKELDAMQGRYDEMNEEVVSSSKGEKQAEVPKEEIKPIYKIGDKEVSKQEMVDFVNSGKAKESTEPLFVEGDTEVEDMVKELGGEVVEKFEEQKVEVPVEEKPSEVKRIIEPTKPISEMNSEEMDNFATETRRALKAQDKEFENKTEQEKEEGGYYDFIDEVEDLRDASERINFIENAENINELANSVKSIVSKMYGEAPNEYQLAILNATKKKAAELGIDPKSLIKKVTEKIASQYKDIGDAELMVKNAFEKLIPKEEATFKAEVELPPTPEKVTPKVEEEITPKEAKEGDTVELPSQVKGGLPRTIIFSEGEWKQKVGDNITNVGENVKQQAQAAFEGIKAEVAPEVKATEPIVEEVKIEEKETTAEGKFVKVANNQYSDGTETKYIVPTSNSELGGHIEVSKEVYEKWKELDDVEKMRIDRLKKSPIKSESQKQKEIRGVAMAFAAEKRKILGTETARETSVKEEKENKVRINDKATINNIEYTVLGFPYGKIKLSTKSESGVGQITIERGSNIEKEILKQKPKETTELKGEHIPNLDFYLSELNKEKELGKPKAEAVKPKEPTAEKVEPKAELPKEVKVGKFEEQARKIADKISKAELPNWFAPESLKDVKRKGISAEDLKRILAEAVIKMGKLLDEGVEFSKALKQAASELVNIRGEENREIVEKGFEDYYRGLKEEVPLEKLKESEFGEGEQGKENKKEFNKLTSTIPNTGEVTKYLSGETIKKYEGEEARNEQEVFVQQLREALVRGVDIVNKGREIFGEDYVQKLLDYVETENLPPANKALIYVSLENEVAKQKIENPSKAQQLEKLQDLVRAKSQAFLRSSSLAINFGRLRKIAEVGYDISRLTNDFFSSKQMEQKRTIEKAIEATPDDINKQAEELRRKIEEGVEQELAKIYEKLPKEKKAYADKVLSALDKIQQQLRSKAYADFTGMTALIDAGITTIKAAIKAGVKVADAIELGINKIKESYQEKTGESWKKEDEFRKDITEAFKSEGIKEPKKEMSKSEFNRLEKEILELDRQIQKGEKDKFDKKKSKESDELDRLRKEKEEKQAILEALDPTPKIFIENALIEQGFGRQINVKTKEGVEKRWVLDWKKLAGEEGSVDNIRQRVESALKDKGYTEEQILRMKDAFVGEYNNLRASIIEKSMNEIATKNKQTVTPEQKAAVKKLAEMYNYGLFDKDPAEYELAIAKTLGLSVASQNGIKKAIEMGEAMSNMFNVNYEGRPLTESQLRTAIQVIEEKMRAILYSESMKEGNVFFKLSNLTKIYMDMAQRMLLNTVKQGIENPFSGLLERFYSSIGYSGKIPSKLNSQQRELARDIYKEMVLQKGIGYGNVGTAFVAKGNIDAYIGKMSDHQLVNGIISMGMGKPILDAVDSAFKAKITQQKFTYNLIKILTQDRKINGKIEKGMSLDEAKKYVAEKISGQSFENAKETARKIIENVNKNAGEKVFNDSEQFVNRLATDIVNASLVNGEKITEEMVTVAYNSAYKAAGRGLGHVANNFISDAVSTVSGKIESKINDAIKEKNYTKAARLNFYSIFYRNIANPFVGGGTNWLVLKAEKSGLGLFSGLYSLIGKEKKPDLTTESGLKQLENSLYEEMKIRDQFIRGAIGGAVTALTYLLIKGTDTDDKFEEWLKKNEWTKKYTNIITPEVALALMASKSEKSYKKYLESSFNKNEAFDKMAMAIKAATYLAVGKKEEGYGKLGELVGGSVGTPIPWRLVRDGQQIYVGATGGKPYRVNPKPSKSLLTGFLKGGMIDYLGYAPKDKDLVFGGKMGEPGIKMLIDNGLELPEPPKVEEIKVAIDEKHPKGEMTKEEAKEYLEIWTKNLIANLNQIKQDLKSQNIAPSEEELKKALETAKRNTTKDTEINMISKGKYKKPLKKPKTQFEIQVKSSVIGAKSE